MSYFAPRQVTGTSPERKPASMSPISEVHQAAVQPALPATPNKPSLADELAQAEGEVTSSVESSPAGSPKFDQTTGIVNQTTGTVKAVRFKDQRTADTASDDSVNGETLTNSVEDPDEVPQKLPPKENKELPKNHPPKEEPRPNNKLPSLILDPRFQSTWIHYFVNLYYNPPSLTIPRSVKRWFQRTLVAFLLLLYIWLIYHLFATVIPFVFKALILLFAAPFVLVGEMLWGALVFPFVLGGKILRGVSLLEIVITRVHLATGAALTGLLATWYFLNKKRYLVFSIILILSLVLPPVHIAFMTLLVAICALGYIITKAPDFVLFGLVILGTLVIIEIQTNTREMETTGFPETALRWSRTVSNFAWAAHVRVADFYWDYTRWLLKKSGASGSLGDAFPLGLELDEKFIQFTDAHVKGTFLKVQFILVQFIAPFLARAFLTLHYMALRVFGNVCAASCVKETWPHWCGVYYVWDKVAWNRESVRYLWRYGVFWVKDLRSWPGSA